MCLNQSAGDCIYYIVPHLNLICPRISCNLISPLYGVTHHLHTSRHGNESVFERKNDKMPSVATIASIFIKVLKLILNFIIILIYRYGYGGSFLGVGGTWNLNEEKNPDAEIIASGVLIGFFIYTSVILISYCFGTLQQKKSLVDIIMNFIGTIMFIAVGGVALHYWTGYQSEHKYTAVSSEKMCGIAVGALCVITGAVYLVDTVLAFIHFARDLDFK